jgi:hypothetical protein
MKDPPGDAKGDKLSIAGMLRAAPIHLKPPVYATETVVYNYLD